MPSSRGSPLILVPGQRLTEPAVQVHRCQRAPAGLHAAMVSPEAVDLSGASDLGTELQVIEGPAGQGKDAPGDLSHADPVSTTEIPYRTITSRKSKTTIVLGITHQTDQQVPRRCQ